MSEQVLDLRRFLRIAFRHKAILVAATVLGLLAGLGFTLFNPPLFTSNALVLLAPSATRFIGTQVVIAASDPVLAGAQPLVTPPVSLQALRNDVKATSLTSNIVSITAKGHTTAQAESIANAVAESYIDYVGRKNSAVGKVQAEVLSIATHATLGSLRIRLIITGVIGMLLGALIGAIIAVAVGRNRGLLRERDEIAAASGAPVLASIPVRHPSGPGGWTRLLEEYEPGVVHATSLGRVLHRVGLARVLSGEAGDDFRYSIQVMSLASDAGALALGPQLAAFAASLGIPTALVIGPQQEAKATAGLRAACETKPYPPSKRASHLEVSVLRDGDGNRPHAALLTIVVCVVHGRTPRVADMMPTTATLLAVSAGAATSEQLAQVAATCAADGRRIAGVVVADPDSADQTTGRRPQRRGSASRVQPTRATGLTTEIRQ
jgi:capsular polysaccharide biosynthesis protein